MAQIPKQAPQLADGTEKKAGQTGRPEPVPTPLRRRSVSPATDVASRGLAVEQKAAADTAPGTTYGRRGLGLVAGVAMLAFACFRPALPWIWHKSTEKASRQVPSVATADPQPEEAPRLPALIRQALECQNLKADILDVIAGAPYEFSVGEDQEGFFHLPRLAAAAQKSQKVEELRKAVLQIAATGGGWPLQLQERLLQLLQTPCEARSCLFAPAPLPLEVDEHSTSPRALSGGWLHQAFLTMGSITGIPSFRARAELYRSQPPSVMLSNASITQMRDCFAFRGSKGQPPALAMRLRYPSVVHQLVIEQPPRWAALRPDSLQRRFSVYGATQADASNSYTEKLGDFVYSAAGPAVQAFHLANASAPLTGLRMIFEGPESDKQYICLYRLKLFEGTETACSNGRAAWRLQSNLD